MAEAPGLGRFTEGQEEGGAYERALAELAAGRKTSHWMWFVFPQVVGLGSSPTARFFGVRGLAEARQYVAHPVLGPRLIRAAGAAETAPARDVQALLGPIDALKLRSSMTLFGRAEPEEPVYARVLDRWYGGAEDEATLALL